MGVWRISNAFSEDQQVFSRLRLTNIGSPQSIGNHLQRIGNPLNAIGGTLREPSNTARKPVSQAEFWRERSLT